MMISRTNRLASNHNVKRSILTDGSCVATLSKLCTPMCLCHQAVYLGTGQRMVTFFSWEGTAGLAKSNGSLPPGDDLTDEDNN